MDEWQEDVLRASMGERSDGRWAARQVACSAPRQQGKTMLIVARVLAGLLLFNERIIVVSAHRQDTAREVFFRLVELIEDNSSLSERVDFIARSEMREYIRMKSGQEVRFKARSSGSGRGFSCDCLLLDEAQILAASAWSAILPTMSARPNPQVFLFGTPPTPLDDGEVFSRIRGAAISGRSSGLAYLEWSADQDDDLDDPATWARANPAYPSRISHEAIASERASMSDEQFGMERLGMWTLAGSHQVIPAQSWADAGDELSAATGRLAFGVEVGPDMAWASVVLAGQRSDEDWHLELDERRDGTAWLAPYLAAMLGANPAVRAVMVDVGGPVAAMLERRGARWFFKDSRVQVTPVTVAGLGAGCSLLLNGIVTGSVHHTRQPQMDAAVKIAGKRRLGDTGLWVFSRSSTHADITPVLGAVLALIGAQAGNVKKPTREGGGRRVGTF